eukprot:NODE_11184_length_1302_cov_9.110638.p1 GENE.NODE_11184_length_1302_cov_9.110638~~NODE_11184_length_1302_cov_9.110638.p1  ORF type:complete len:281 (+),score=64.73 NODE_11184_length_1302_cov_9.110638:130-972(+)
MVAPAPVRAVILVLWLVTFTFGVLMICNPYGDRAVLERKVMLWMHGGLPVNYAVYFFDSTFSALPCHWTSMHSIPVRNVLQHHLPIFIAATPLMILSLTVPEEFKERIMTVPPYLTYMTASHLVAINEATWVIAGFLPKAQVEDWKWKKVKAAASVFGLLDCIVLGGGSGLAAVIVLVPELWKRGEHFYLHGGIMLALFFSVLPMLFQVPVVQIPLLRSALRRLCRPEASSSEGPLVDCEGPPGAGFSTPPTQELPMSPSTGCVASSAATAALLCVEEAR